ncbi:MAG: hypothetical protein QOF66_2196 [Mycobacterium sp.]|uniref:hypothetical protein n=1 Tax=Mycobacterium sp. TaxID=1785 RepID=UPI0028B2A196|nr:hypothetical protein [Mycobacterium sp.]
MIGDAVEVRLSALQYHDGAIETDDDNGPPSTSTFGVLRNTDGVEHTTVQATAVHHPSLLFDTSGPPPAPMVAGPFFSRDS